MITHSRGGLVLRTLVEMAKSLGPNAARFQLGRAVLVASPNDGTPLASPNRFEDFVNWLSNLIDMLPDNPFTSAAGFVAEALAWLAHAVQVDIPGLAAMNSQGAAIHQLQSSSGPPPKAYSSLVSNFQPEKNILTRMLDVGVDAQTQPYASGLSTFLEAAMNVHVDVVIIISQRHTRSSAGFFRTDLPFAESYPACYKSEYVRLCCSMGRASWGGQTADDAFVAQSQSKNAGGEKGESLSLRVGPSCANLLQKFRTDISERIS